MIRTVSESLLASCSPIPGEGGNVVRAFCPFHGSDHQRSLRVDLRAGHFQCFACGAHGYLESASRPWRRVQVARARFFGMKPPAGTAPLPRSLPEPTPLPLAVLAQYEAYRKVLPGSPAERYLAERGIPLHIALRYGLGYAEPRKWAHRAPNGKPARWWKHGRVVAPETNPRGEIVNLYGRAIGDAPRGLAHDHLPGPKGWFNTEVIRTGDGPLVICEGVFDALSLLAAGCYRTLAIIGVNGWRWPWVSEVEEFLFAFDADEPGQCSAQQLARQCLLHGKRARALPAEVYHGLKDVNEAWQAGVLDLGGLE